MTPPAKIFSKGTLLYTKAGLALLFFFLLWGDFVLGMVETIVPKILPLQFKAVGASNMIMALVVVTVPSLCNMFVNPIVSFRSDNLRTAWGRRIPYLMAVTPVITALLIATGFAPEIGRALHGSALAHWIRISPNTCVIAVLAGVMILFQIFNLCLQPVYVYLFIDVVPDNHMARFMALFKIVGSLQAYIFSSFLYGHALTHTRAIYVGCALAYFVGFMAICLWVKEGEYPPPVHSKMGLTASIRVYLQECFSHRHYIYFNLRNACFAVATVVNMYEVFVYRDDLGLSLGFIGKVGGWANLILMALFYPMGVLCDRYNPVRMVLLGAALGVGVPLGKFFWMHSQGTFVAFTLLTLPIAALVSASDLPFQSVILPRDRFGQFGSANQIVIALLTIGGSLLAGRLMDWATAGGTQVGNYRYLYVWAFGFQVLALIFMALLYRSWKKHGGDQYRAPSPWLKTVSVGQDSPL